MMTCGRDHYDQLYIADLEQEAEWLRRGAREKANSVDILSKSEGIRPEKILELGCGTGAVIEECQRRKLGTEYVAVDYSHSALSYLRGRCPTIRIIHADITDPEFSLQERFHLLVLSHVIEHLEEPATFLRSMQRAFQFDYAVIEVPLEDLPLSRLKSRFRDRKNHKAGHVQFFTQRTFEQLVKDSGLNIVGRRQYIPIPDIDTIRFVAAKDNLPWWKVYQMILTRRIIPLLGLAL
jgi:SAM-dependent methyltransferase